LLLEATHAGWNEWGAGLRLGVGDLEVTAFGARGYAPESTAWSAGPAFGARARYAVGEAITVGASGAALFDADVVLQLGLAEVDAEAELGGVRLRAEGLVQVGGEGGAVLGGYLTAHRAFGWVEVAARAEVVAQAGEVTPRLGATAGVVVWPEHLLVRAEYDTDLSRLEDRVQLQVVAAL
jgi:hypothetical protein